MPKYKPLKKRSRIINFQDSLLKMTTLPAMCEVANRIKCIQKQCNGRSLHPILRQVAEEVIGCWKSQDLPTQIIQTVVNKLKRFYKRRKGIYLSANV